MEDGIESRWPIVLHDLTLENYCRTVICVTYNSASIDMEPPSAAWGALESAETRFVTDIQWPTWLKLSNLDEQGGKSESRRAE